ncbi:MAG TPA: ATP-binding cassette domain-containing protein [Solirubrobacteraceae bacterium]
MSSQVRPRDAEPNAAGANTRSGGVASALGSMLFAARFVPIWLAVGLLFIVAAIIAPETLTSASFNSGVLPLMTFVAIAAIGEMLVVMTGGIDLSMAGTITLVGALLVGVSHGSNHDIVSAIVICLLWAALIGFTNGTLVAIVGLNPLIVTLATGQILYGISTQYLLGTSSVAGVPASMANWALKRFLGVSEIFWVGIAIMIVAALVLRYARAGRRFQAVGANPQAAWISGLRIRGYVVLAYVGCSVLGGIAAILLSTLIQTPNIDLGDPYLLGPISAVVIAGASLLGGLASTSSTWVAAFALTLLSQMLQVLGLTSALQYVVYGAAIIIGMLVSGDRIANLCSRFLIRRGPAANLLAGTAAAEIEAEADEQAEELAEQVSAETARAVAAAHVAPHAHGATAALALEGLSKRFGAVQAVDHVSIQCYPGEVHAVVGENGSGKSTLLGMACGMLPPDTGSITIDGQQLGVASVADAMNLGVGMTYQSFSQVLQMSIAENLYLSAAPAERPAFGAMEEWAAAFLREVGIELDPAVQVRRLTLADRQFLEIAKALVRKPKVLMLDEPTTALGPGEVEKLHKLVRERTAQGVAVVYVSHRLPEVLGLATRVTVLRDGRWQGTFEATELSEAKLVALMIGRPLELAFPEREPIERATAALIEVEGLRGERFGPIDLKLMPGEIVGIAGAEGNGQGQFLRALAGVEHSSGSVRREGGRGVSLRSPRTALAAGLALLSADRANESLFPVLGVRANATIQVLRRFSHLGVVSRRQERSAVLDVAGPLQVRAASTEQPVAFLSGGNQQKVVLMRPFLRPDLKVLLVDEPTQGVDVKSRFDIYRALREKVAEGCAVVIKSSDPLELSGVCDRVIVMSRGRIVEEIPAAELTPPAGVGERRIIEAIVGSRPASTAHALAPDSPDAGTDAHEPNVAAPQRARRGLRYRNWMPIAVIVLFMIAIGVYTNSRTSAFAGDFNLSGLFVSVVPLALVAMGQLNAMLVAGFDVSVGAVMTICVVIASFTMASGESWIVLFAGSLAVIAVACGAGIFNSVLIRLGKLSPIIATLATLSIFQGLSLVLRPIPAGIIDLGVVNALTKAAGPIPYSFIGVVVLAVLWDIWLYRTGHGLSVRAVGYNETAASRTGLRAGRIFVRGFLLSALLAGAGAIFLGAQIDVGDPNSGLPFALESIAAAVLGGAALTGGRGSFVGATIGALFLFLIINVLPYLNISSAYGQVATGALTLIALSAYSGPDIWARMRAAIDPILAERRVRRETQPAA